jgi:hypothetical protein
MFSIEKKYISILLLSNIAVFIIIYNNIQTSSKNELVLKDGECKCMEKRYPKAILIGFKKCGTGALMKFIGAHPEIVTHKDELYFFYFNFHKGYEWYR